jgi:hypothetical protein
MFAVAVQKTQYVGLAVANFCGEFGCERSIRTCAPQTIAICPDFDLLTVKLGEKSLYRLNRAHRLSPWDDVVR